MIEINRYTESLQYNLEAAARVVQEAISAKFKEKNFGLSYDEFIILDEISHEPGILQIELAKRILKGRAYTGKFLIALEEKGFVERRSAIKGKRQVVMPNFITAKGKKVHKTAVNLIKEYVDAMPSVADKDIGKIINFLKTLKKDVEEKFQVKFV